MDLYHKRLDSTFLICLILTLTAPVIFPGFRLLFFVPFQIMMYYQRSFRSCLWSSLLCGTIVDLFSSYTRLGICALDYTLTTYILYRQRENFFSDSLSSVEMFDSFNTQDEHRNGLVTAFVNIVEQHGIWCRVFHIPGEENTIADALSRFNNRSFRRVDMSIQELKLTMLSAMLTRLRLARP